MLKRLAAAIGLALLVWGTSCAHRYARTENRYLQEAERIKWESAVEKHEESKQQTARDEQRKVTGRTVVKKPDGTVIDTTWVDEAVAKYTAHAESASDSRSTAGGEKEKAKKAESNLNVQAVTSVRLPWFRIGAGVALVALLVYLYLRWRARRIRLG